MYLGYMSRAVKLLLVFTIALNLGCGNEQAPPPTGLDLEVTITLDTLRPRKTWTSSADDIVLIARTDDLDDVTATYTVTADGYNELFEGGPITIPVERVSAFNTLGDLLGVDDDGDDE